MVNVAKEVGANYIVHGDLAKAQELVAKIWQVSQYIVGVVTNPNGLWDQSVYFMNVGGTLTRADISIKDNPIKYTGGSWLVEDSNTPVDIQQALRAMLNNRSANSEQAQEAA